MYTSLPANTIKDQVNKIYYPKADAKGTELTAAIMRAAHSSKSEKVFLSSNNKLYLFLFSLRAMKRM
jgi:hypothetical protein